MRLKIQIDALIPDAHPLPAGVTMKLIERKDKPELEPISDAFIGYGAMGGSTTRAGWYVAMNLGILRVLFRSRFSTVRLRRFRHLSLWSDWIGWGVDIPRIMRRYVTRCSE